MFNKFNRSIVSAVLSATLLVNWSMPAHAANEEFHRKAREYVRLTNESADAIALQLIQDLLLKIIMNGQGTNVQSIADAALNMQGLANEIQNGALLQLSQQKISIDELIGKKSNLETLKKHVREYLYSVSKLESLNVAYRNNTQNLHVMQKSASFVFENLITDLKPVCNTGIAIDPKRPQWQSIPAILPSYEVFIGAQFSTEDGSFQGPSTENRTSLSILKDPDANAAAMTTLYALSVILGEYLVTGKIVLTTLATTSAATATTGAAAGGAAAGGGALSAMGVLAGTGIFLAVVAVAYILMDQNARHEADRVLDSNKKIFYESADAETVRNRFKAHCNNTVEAIRSAKIMFEGIQSGNPLAKAELENAKANTQIFLDELKTRFESINKEKQNIASAWIAEKKFEKNPFVTISELENKVRDLKRDANRFAAAGNESNRKATLEEIARSEKEIEDLNKQLNELYTKFDDMAENKSFSEYMKSVTPEQLREVMKVILVESSVGIDQVSTALMKNLDDMMMDFNMEDIRKQARNYVSVLQVIEMTSSAQAFRKNTSRMKYELALVDSLKEFDALFLTYISLAFAQPSPENDSKLSRLKTSIRDWYKNFQSILKLETNKADADVLLNAYKFAGNLK